MIRSFQDAETKAIFQGGKLASKEAKRAGRRLPRHLWRKARAKLDALDVATSPAQLTTPSNRLERLSGDRDGQYSIRINRQYRVCFDWRDSDAWNVEITDYH